MKKILVCAGLLCTLVSFAFADRYDDLINKWYGRYGSYGIGASDATDAMTLAWNCMNSFHAYCYAYDLTKQKVIADNLYAALNNNIVGGTRPNPMGRQEYLITSDYKNPAATWWTDGVEYTGESFRIIEGVLHWVYLVKTNTALQSQYGAIADRYLKKMEDTLVANWLTNCFIDESKDSIHDFHYTGAGKLVQPTCTTCTVNPYLDLLLSSPHNKMADFGMAMVLLYKITGKAKYRDIITKAAMEFKSKLLWKNGGQYYAWHYYDPFWRWDFINYRLGGQPRHGVWIEHRAGYGGLDMAFMSECYRMGIVFCKEDIRRFVRTNRDIMWDGVTTELSGGTWLANDGSVPIDYGGLYPALCAYDTTLKLTNLAYNWYNTNYTDYGAECGIPYYVYVMKLTGTALAPPDTMHWTGPLEVINVEPLNRGAIRLTFYNPVDSASVSTLTNYYFTRFVQATGVVINPVDRRIVTVYTTPHDTVSRAMKLFVRKVKDIYGNRTFAYNLGNQPYAYNSSTDPVAVHDPGVLARTVALSARLEANPVSERAVIRFFTSPQCRPDMASVFDANGRRVFSQTVGTGVESLAWDCRQARPGVYLVRINYPHQQVILRLMVTR